MTDRALEGSSNIEGVGTYSMDGVNVLTSIHAVMCTTGRICILVEEL